MFYFYEGSLTYPPCTENVHWWVDQNVHVATREEIRFFKKSILRS